ncbi:MAG TPA: tryptophan synthase subunit alpha [Bryobacteraceae bacterium]
MQPTRIQLLFDEVKKQSRAALIAYVTAGDPTPERTPGIVAALERGGVDLIELGVPFSDPIADGPVIQRGADRALRAGTSVSKVLEMARKIREHSEIPLLLFTYMNPVLRYGLERLAADAKAAGIDGCLLTDLSVEEAGTGAARPIGQPQAPGTSAEPASVVPANASDTGTGAARPIGQPQAPGTSAEPDSVVPANSSSTDPEAARPIGQPQTPGTSAEPDSVVPANSSSGGPEAARPFESQGTPGVPAGSYIGVMRSAGLDTVFLAAPTSTDARLKLAAQYSSGFVYLVSRTGVTGERAALSNTLEPLIARTRAVTNLPLAAGFGISTPEQAGVVAKMADGVVVGSAIVRMIEKNASSFEKCEAELEAFARSLRDKMSWRA